MSKYAKCPRCASDVLVSQSTFPGYAVQCGVCNHLFAMPEPESSPLYKEESFKSIGTADRLQSTLDQRGKTHGDFDTVAFVAQRMKTAVRSFTEFKSLPTDQAEAVEMIITKIARIVSGGGAHKDSWDDIEGYAHLGSKDLK
jgi:hypothetical protein